MKLEQIFLSENNEPHVEQLRQDIAQGKVVHVVMASYSRGEPSIGDLVRMRLVAKHDDRAGHELHRTYEVVGDVNFTTNLSKSKVYHQGDIIDGGYWDPT